MITVSHSQWYSHTAGWRVRTEGWIIKKHYENQQHQQLHKIYMWTNHFPRICGGFSSSSSLSSKSNPLCACVLLYDSDGQELCATDDLNGSLKLPLSVYGWWCRCEVCMRRRDIRPRFANLEHGCAKLYASGGDYFIRYIVFVLCVFLFIMFCFYGGDKGILKRVVLLWSMQIKSMFEVIIGFHSLYALSCDYIHQRWCLVLVF